ncbi:protein translocase subunit SecF [Cellvibrio sp. ARAG 10.3]|uniref:protein translocase subunit SecF n=1 Tax=Cellvibrio sp. ARAG 10.3 TaxID=3451358 RepID=UPI003F4617EC
MTQEPKVINFMGVRKFASAFSILLVIASIVSLAVNGLKLGLDFTGGTQMEVGFEQPADIPQIRSILVDEGLQSPVAVLFGSESEVLIRTQGSMQDGALIKLERELSALGEDVNVAAVERAPREKERFAHQLLISNITPAQLQQAGIFSESVYGDVEFEARNADTAVVIERTLDTVYANHLLARLSNEAGSTAELRRSEFVGPQIGEELRDEGGLGILCALIVVMLYVAIRFQWKFSVGAVVALMHDVIIVLGIFSIFHLDFDLTVLAAVLAVIGYSINDTIVVFDRIRDNFRTLRKSESAEVINYSLSQTLERTVLTSLTTLLTLFMLYIFGGELISGFALALIIGIGVGTYSSVYIAAAMLMGLNITKEDLLPPVKEGAEFDEAP